VQLTAGVRACNQICRGLRDQPNPRGEVVQVIRPEYTPEDETNQTVGGRLYKKATEPAMK
jgi:hypothetical protein